MSVNMENRTLFTIIKCMDKSGNKPKEMREALMMEHLSYIETILDKVLVAGPIFDDDNKSIIGSLLVYKTDDKAQARSYLEADPYYTADIWGDISVNVFRGALGDAVGGKAY